MASEHETLNIGSIRLTKEYPIASTQPHQHTDAVIHPGAAAAAREKIAAIPDASALLQGSAVPAVPTAELITNKYVLAEQAKQTKKPADAVVKPRQMPSALRPLLTAVGIFAIVLLLFKAPIILSQLGYSLGTNNGSPNAAPAAATEVIPAENTISIPKINLHAPVVYEPSVAEAAVQKALENGVVHYGNTAFPGQTGNTAIFGHSSNDWWEPGNYKFVFVLLDKLAVGDQISIDYQSKRYTYEVTSTKVVEPTDVSVLNKTSEPTLTLITCSPPGTSLRRLVVTAKQITPDPTQASSVAAQPSTAADSSLPSSSPGFFTQVSQAWNGILTSIKSLFGGSSAAPASDTPSGSLPAIK